MLLRYLKQARDADNHSIQELAEFVPGGVGLNFANGSGGYIHHLEIINGVITRYEGDPMIATSYPARVSAMKVLNAGKWYNPPTSHLNNPVASSDPRVLGDMGINFYESFIDEAEARFFT